MFECDYTYYSVDKITQSVFSELEEVKLKYNLCNAIAVTELQNNFDIILTFNSYFNKTCFKFTIIFKPLKVVKLSNKYLMY